MNFLKAGFIISAAGSVLLLAGCGSEKVKQEGSTEMSVDSAERHESVKKVFYSIPSPIQATSLLKKAGAQYSKDLLNPLGNETKYSTSFKKAANMGIYGADLAYCNMFDQTQEALNYLNVVNKLANSIGMTSVIESTGVFSRFQANLGNKDSLMVILADLFRESDDYLKENQQYNTASLVLATGWVEALYIATVQAKKNSKKEMKQLIAEQKSSLNSVLALLPASSNEPELTDFKNDLNQLKDLYINVKIEHGEQKAVTDAAAKTTTLTGETSVVMNDDQLAKITEKVMSLRTKLIN